MGNISLETETPVEGEHISLTVYTEEHISAGCGQGYVYGETHITGEHISTLHRFVIRRMQLTNESMNSYYDHSTAYMS